MTKFRQHQEAMLGDDKVQIMEVHDNFGPGFSTYKIRYLKDNKHIEVPESKLRPVPLPSARSDRKCASVARGPTSPVMNTERHLVTIAWLRQGMSGLEYADDIVEGDYVEWLINYKQKCAADKTRVFLINVVKLETGFAANKLKALVTG